MIERYLIVAGRIRQELKDLEHVVARVAQAIAMARQHTEDQALYIDAAALNLHDFYTGLERIFHYIATVVDRNAPSGPEWHRDLLRQMGMALPQIRPQVLSAETMKALDEYLRFRHVVRNVYAFEFDLEQIERLTQRLPSSFERVRSELLAFAEFLDRLAQQE